MVMERVHVIDANVRRVTKEHIVKTVCRVPVNVLITKLVSYVKFSMNQAQKSAPN